MMAPVAKSILFIAVFACLMILLFPVMVYLMTTVNPKPLSAIDITDNRLAIDIPKVSMEVLVGIVLLKYFILKLHTQNTYKYVLPIRASRV